MNKGVCGRLWPAFWVEKGWSERRKTRWLGGWRCCAAQKIFEPKGNWLARRELSAPTLRSARIAQVEDFVALYCWLSRHPAPMRFGLGDK